jgi:hypothetical protein
MIARESLQACGKRSGSRSMFGVAAALLCLILATGCSMRGTPFNTTVVRDGDRTYTYKGGVVHCPDGRSITYHPTDYEKESGFSIPSVCNYH